jgi:3-methylfumaryl-CoA hydratase
MMETNFDQLRQWIGKTETLEDRATLAPLQALAATLDRDDPPPRRGDAVQPCWHWLYFLPLQRASGIGPDGHPKRGGFLPPVPLPRRMWAGSRITLERPLAAGEAIRRESRIDDVSVKQGRTGTLVFVRVRHSIGSDDGPAIVEEQDIVYRAMSQPGEAAPSPKVARTDEQFSRRVVPDPVLLFRYSALTFNGHRIHYDRPYATGEEGYPGLVVHGPLIATLLLDLLRRSRPDLRVVAFEFKAVSPLIDTAPFEVCGRVDDDTATLWARGPSGGLAMEARATVVADSALDLQRPGKEGP